MRHTAYTAASKERTAMPPSTTTSTKTDTVKLGRLLYETRLPELDRRLISNVMRRVLVSTLLSIVAAAIIV